MLSLVHLCAYERVFRPFSSMYPEYLISTWMYFLHHV